MTALLPLGWAEVTLSDVLCIRNGYAFKSKEFQKHGIPVIRQSNLAGDTVNLSNAVFLPSSYLDEYPQFQIGKGDILIGMSGSIGKLCTYTENFPALQNQRTGKVELPDGYPDLSRYIWYILHTVQDRLTEKGKGVGVQNVSAKDIESLSFWLPPLPEQRRIVAKIEALQERSRKARAALEAIPPLLEQFHQSVLAAAFRGDLTADWRAQHPNVEPASVLLDRIRAERRRRWEGAELAKMQAKGKIPKDEKWKERYEEPKSPDLMALPSLPAGWCYATLGQLLSESLANGRSVPDAQNGCPVLRLTALRKGKVDLSQRKIGAWTEADAKPYLVKKGDFLVARGNGSLALVGRGGLVDREPDSVAYPDTLIRVRTNETIILSQYLQTVWASSSVRSQIESSARTTAGIYKINQQDMQRWIIPLPPLNEQQRIASEVERLKTIIDELEITVTADLELLDQLDQSILAKAFRGELVPQDPNDEPASVLLDRIRAEREAQSAKPRIKKKTPGSTNRTKKAPPVSVNENDDLPLFNSLQK